MYLTGTETHRRLGWATRMTSADTFRRPTGESAAVLTPPLTCSSSSVWVSIFFFGSASLLIPVVSYRILAVRKTREPNSTQRPPSRHEPGTIATPTTTPGAIPARIPTVEAETDRGRLRPARFANKTLDAVWKAKLCLPSGSQGQTWALLSVELEKPRTNSFQVPDSNTSRTLPRLDRQPS